MAHFTHRFAYNEDVKNPIAGSLELEQPLPFKTKNQGSGFYRQGKISLDGGGSLDIVLYHSRAMSSFIYLRKAAVDHHLLDFIGMDGSQLKNQNQILLPGQLCLGADRAKLIGEAIIDMFSSPVFNSTVSTHGQQNLAVFPIAREGLKYQVTDAIYENFGYYCDEIVLDAHHVFDSSVPVYNRKVEMTLFKDKDLDKQQRENIAVALIADSIASGLVMKEVIAKVKERFEHLEQVEVIAPLATIRGLCRVAGSDIHEKVKVRVHVFETLLNALPPDYYYSAHFNIDEFHIRPDLEKEYRAWWGKDSAGKFIADTACAGYGWSEVFYSPRKQIQMINSQLGLRHNLNIDEIVRRNNV